MPDVYTELLLSLDIEFINRSSHDVGHMGLDTENLSLRFRTKWGQNQPVSYNIEIRLAIILKFILKLDWL